MTIQKPKILYIVKRLSGGIFTYLVELTDRLIQNYDIVIAYSTTPDTPKNFRTYFNENINMIRVESFSESFTSAKNELRELVKQEKPDIIHFHGHGAGKIGRKALDGIQIPMFYTPHGYRYLAEDHNILSRSLIRRDEAQAARYNCMTVACSKGEFAETLGFTKNATYINNGINIDEINEIVKNSQQEIHEKPIVCTTGLINEQKNPALFNEIASAMPDVKFIWIGDGELKYKLTASNIEITGWMDRTSAIQKLNEADVFLLTSLWEGLPISLLEAMYLKKLCIVSNVVGSRDVIHNGENGYICDTAAMYVNIINHYKDEKIQEILENAQQDIIENYNVDTMAKEYDTLYKKYLK